MISFDSRWTDKSFAVDIATNIDKSRFTLQITKSNGKEQEICDMTPNHANQSYSVHCFLNYCGITYNNHSIN